MNQTYRDPPQPLLVVETCPLCRSRLRVKRRRADGEPFLACSAWPACSFAEDLDARCQRLADRIDELEAMLLEAEEERAQLPAEVLTKELRGLIALTHPDRWPRESELAHRVTSELTRIRDALRASA